ncbi:unnamed protein product [Phytophthora fragariaefolia]|uniref:Unnamed protein product n=1 Tax=Phytophthora fragariaefolia TaxID=1490495 RepID=A0A9W6YAD1_9STRA|nr:unnamed protein product [Phytophthora fragariaefolia]
MPIRFELRLDDTLDEPTQAIRLMASPHRAEAYASTYLNNASSLFDECYNLASAQRRKNKDIPAGGSKGIMLLNQAHQDKANVAFRKY